MKHAPYINLENEMQKRNIRGEDIAGILGCSVSTVDKKISGCLVNLDEAVKIQELLFPDCSVEYLFNRVAGEQA